MEWSAAFFIKLLLIDLEEYILRYDIRFDGTDCTPNKSFGSCMDLLKFSIVSSSSEIRIISSYSEL